jgi:geranylgeranyl diphosphate synthase type I
MPSPAPLVEREGVRAGVDAALADVAARESASLARISADATVLGELLATMLSGGKRVRAALCYWSWRAHGGDPSSARRSDVLAAGAALELFQAAALFHDDVMDDSATRRGRPTAHVAQARTHREAGWAGDPDGYGRASAILLGDLALALAHATFVRATDALAAAPRRRALDLFDEMQRVVTVGQFLDMHAQAVAWGDDPVADEARARAVIRAKSAHYSVAHPLEIGAALAGAEPAAIARARGYGVPLGEAFQLRDDLLGVFGDPARTGKPAGDDLREGKRTVLVARAVAGSDPADRALLAQALGTDLAPAALADAQAAIVRSGAVDAVEALISRLATQSLDDLARDELLEPGRSMLLALAGSLVEREA